MQRRTSSTNMRQAVRGSFQPIPLSPRQDGMRSASRMSLSRRDSTICSRTHAETVSDSFIADVGDRVVVPGGWHGIVQYVGPVSGREGVFLGIDLEDEHADKGRNDGTHKGHRYFNTKTPTSGLFAPQGKCQILETIGKRESQVSVGGTKHPIAAVQPATSTASIGMGPPPLANGGQHKRNVSSRSYQVRSESRLQYASSEVHARPDQETSQNTAQQHQQLLNDNARLREALASLQDQHARLEKAKAVQAQEMDEMMMTVKELEAFMASADKGDLTETVAALEAALAERDEKILQLREEAAARRKEFREVTQHQEQTIDQLKMLHEQRIAEMEEQRSEMEERLLSSAGSETINAAEVAKQLSALEAVCDEMQRGSEQAKEAMEVAQSRITQLEEENARLHDEVIESRTAAVAQPSEGAKRLVKKSSLDQLPQNHPQRTSAFGMLEGEVSRLEQENAQIKRSNAQREQATHATIEALEQELQQLRANTSNESSHSLRAQLSRERAQRIALEDRYTELERQLEDTIMQIEQASLPARTVSRSLSTSPSLSIRIPPPVQTPDPVRSPRPHRGKLTDREDEMVEPMSAGHASCEYCGKVGHDMLSCKEVFGTPQAKQPEQPIPAAGSGGVKRFTERKEQIIQQEQMATPPRMDSSGQLWCSYCQRYGIHATEECPDADEQF